MSNIPKYTKILNIGTVYTENALVGKVIIQEKIDGSQFRWGIDLEGKFHVGSRNRELHIEETTGDLGETPELSIGQDAKMFKEGMEHLLKIKTKIQNIGKINIWFYGEYLQKPKHNVLKYDKIPKNHIALFEVLDNGKFLTRDKIRDWANIFNIDLIPELFVGEITTEKLKEFHKLESYLGGTDIEGIVIKNYEQEYAKGGHVYPLFTKYVQSKYREKAQQKARAPRLGVEEYIRSFKSENRWQKAFQYLKEEGQIVNEAKDIGTIIKRVMQDIDEEETENIKKFLFERAIKQIKSYSTVGLASWYKEKLLDRLK